MFHRFAAACSVASVVIAGGALVSLLLGLPLEGAWTLTTAWCFVPVAWGLWAMFAPARWVPNRLPVWGAILGVVAVYCGRSSARPPSRVGGPSGVRWLALVAGPLLYYVLWLLVGSAYRSCKSPVNLPTQRARACWKRGGPCTTCNTCSATRTCRRPVPTSIPRQSACSNRCANSMLSARLASSLQATPPAAPGLMARPKAPVADNPLGIEYWRSAPGRTRTCDPRLRRPVVGPVMARRLWPGRMSRDWGISTGHAPADSHSGRGRTR